MKSLLTISVAAATMTLGLNAQKLETQKPDSKTVTRVETAKDHLTVIELSDAVTMVAVGNRSPSSSSAGEQGICHTDGRRIEDQPLHLDQRRPLRLRTGSRRGRRSNALRHRSDRHGSAFPIPRRPPASRSNDRAVASRDVDGSNSGSRGRRAGNPRTGGGDGARSLSE